jgi:hypothetical protein
VLYGYSGHRVNKSKFPRDHEDLNAESTLCSGRVRYLNLDDDFDPLYTLPYPFIRAYVRMYIALPTSSDKLGCLDNWLLEDTSNVTLIRMACGERVPELRGPSRVIRFQVCIKISVSVY